VTVAISGPRQLAQQIRAGQLGTPHALNFASDGDVLTFPSTLVNHNKKLLNRPAFFLPRAGVVSSDG